MRKKLFYLLTFLLATAIGYDVGWAAETAYKTQTFSSSTMQKGVSSYTSNWTNTCDGMSWTIVNFNNNNKGWDYIKCGNNKNASTATITTASLIDKAITKVVVTVGSTKNCTSTTLEVATNSSFTAGLQTISATMANGDVTYTIPNPTANCYYRLTYNQAKGSSNGETRIDKVIYYYNPDEGGGSVPRLEVESTTPLTPLKFEAFINDNDAKTVDVYGYNLTGNISLEISGDNASMFSVSDASLTPDDGGEVSEEVTITYTPEAFGDHSATLTIKSEGADDVTVELSGSGVILTEAPVLADAADVTPTSFKAVWTDETDAAYVRDYTLYVNKVEETPEPSYELKQIGDFTNGKPEGWSNSAKGINWNKESGYLQLGAGSNPGTVTSPSIDFTGYTKATVIVNTKLWDSGSDMTVTIGESNSTTITGITGDYADHIAVVDISNISDLRYLTVTLGAASGKRLYVKNARIYAGDASSVLSSSGAPRLKEVVEAGDADDDGLVVTGITAKEYTVNDLTAGETYEFYVKANYIDDSNAQSNKNEVTLPDNAPRLAVNPSSLTFDEQYTGVSTQKTFSVSGANLSGNVTLSVSGDYFTVEPTTLTPTAGTLAATTVTVTYAPTVADTHNATITISSDGAEDVTVALSGSAVLKKEVPEMLPAVTETEVGDTWFVAKWTDDTPVANVSSYTLYVNKVEETPEPSYELKQTGDFTNGKPEGWSNSAKGISWNKTSGYLQLGAASNPGTVTSPSIDFTGYTKATVIVNTKLWDSGSDMTVTIGESNSTTITGITNDYADHIAVVDISNISDLSDLTVTLGAASGQRLYVKNARIYAGDASSVLSSSGAPRLKEVEETGDASTRTITGISGNTKTYRVSGLTSGAKYDYKVKAVYVDQTESALSNEERVTLKLTINEKTLAEIVASGEEDKIYTVTDRLIGVYADDNNTLWAKDEATSIDANEKPDGYTDFLKQAFTQDALEDLGEAGITVPTIYSQNNWIALVMPAGTKASDYVGNYLPESTVTGVLTDDVNYKLTLTKAPGEPVNTKAYTKNVYTPANFVSTFWGENTSSIYFVKPKVQEVANIVWAVWDGVDSFVMPNKIPGEAKAASFKPDFSLNGSTPTLNEGDAYAFEAVIENAVTTLSGARRLKNEGSPTAFTVKPLNLTSSSPVTGISTVGGSVKEVTSVRVYNVAGVEQRELQTGVNIVVTTYTDGTRTTAKILK